jgi:hypothetical protein
MRQMTVLIDIDQRMIIPITGVCNMIIEYVLTGINGRYDGPG